ANANLLPRTRRAQTLLKGMALAGVGVLAYLTTNPLSDGVHFSVGMPAMNGSIALLLLAVLSSPSTGIAALFEGRILGWLGRISYGVYLWHWPIHHLMLKLDLYAIPGVAPVLGLALSIAVAALSYHGFEKFFLRLKRHSRRKLEALPAS
ncbi:MAG: acyltransferase, partial [Planctomycetota bacterium]